jgi:hypothetical protein
MKRGNRKSNKNIKKYFYSTTFLTKSRRGIITEYLPWIIIALLVLVMVFIAIFILRGTGNSFIDQLKNIFRRT